MIVNPPPPKKKKTKKNEGVCFFQNEGKNRFSGELGKKGRYQTLYRKRLPPRTYRNLGGL